MADAGRDGHVSSFCDLTGASPEQATEYLSATGWDLETAVASFYADAEEGDSAPTTATPTLGQAADDSYSGPRTLDGRPAPQYASASSSSKKVPKKKGLATLSSLGAGHAHDDDDDDEDEEEDEGRGPRDLFAGGEKSGLAVQDPKMDRGPSSAQKVIKDILSRAKANASRPGPDEEEAGPSRSGAFRGTGQTLGGEGVESRSIPDPLGAPTSRQATTEGEGATQMRTLHLWQDGFSIDDGELRRFDDPAHAMDLQLIRQGRAPLHLMDVRYDQPVDVKLQQHEENWRQLPRIYRPFGGEGRRLGSPVPGDSASGASAMSASAAADTATSQPASSRQAPEVDSSQPTIMLRIQLADGTRLPARFNSTHTVGDVYDFVQRASPETTTRDWVLATTFPNKDHTDRGLVLGEMPEFKRGGTAVVKWT